MSRSDAVFDYNTIENAFMFVLTGDPSSEAYLDRWTGKSIYCSVYSDELPENLGDTTRYVRIPDRFELDQGAKLAMRFAADVAPSLLDDVDEAFQGRGGFRRFKDLLRRHDLLDSWYEYESQSERASIQKWCDDNNIRYTMNRPSGG